MLLSLKSWGSPHKEPVMRKLIGTIVIVVALGFLAVQIFGAAMVSNIISGATGAKTSVKRVHLKLFPLEVGIYGTRIHNLEGFKEPEFISIPEIFVRIQPMDLLKGTAHVEKITLNIDQVTFEKAQNGKINLKELLDRSKQKEKESSAEKAPGQKPAPGEPSKPQKGMDTRIDEVLLSLGNLTYADYGSGQRSVKNINLKVENEVLRNVTDTFGLTQQIIMVILKRIGLSTLGIQWDVLAGNAGEQAQELLNQAKGKLSEFFN